jgi:hypothetical protein
MTLAITIPIFETFWALPPDIRVFIGMMLLGLLMAIPTAMWGQYENPFFSGGIIFICIAMLFLLHFMHLEILQTFPTAFTYPNVTLPISIEIK